MSQPAALRVTHVRSFRAMGTDIGITGVRISASEADMALEMAESAAQRWERLFSRFLPDSELAQVNRSNGHPVRVSAEFLTLVDTALQAREESEGRFDPFVWAALVASGYDRDFQDVLRESGPVVPVASRPPADPVEIAIDRSARTVSLPPCVGLDFGGIAKGIFVDRLAETLWHWPGGCLNAGGDIRVWGEPPNGEHWIVGVENPLDSTRELVQICVLTERAQAIATSAMNRRFWYAGATRYHHLIDPATGTPLAGGFISATAIAPNLQSAEVATKSLLVGSSRGESLRMMNATAAILIDQSIVPYLLPGRHQDAFTVYAVDSEVSAA